MLRRLMCVARGTDGGCWGDVTGCYGDKVLLNTNALLVMGIWWW